jgi:predicted PolB exonuclease-like 3'-5' exonuclease
MDKVTYLIFDCEAIADGELVKRVRYPNDDLTPQQAVRRYRNEVLEERGDGKDILPVTYMLPISVAIAKVDAEYRLLDLAALDAPQFRPHVIARHFWTGWAKYDRPTLVSFNGRGYDVPLLELAAFRYGFALPQWFNVDAKTYDQARNRYNADAHLDLCDLLTNFGAIRFSGGLNLLANILGKPGKTGVDGSQVQDFYDAGKTQEINDYCRCDVLDTYFVFLRTRVLLGKLKLDDEQKIVADTKAWLEAKAEQIPAYKHYLEHWGEWLPPPD